MKWYNKAVFYHIYPLGLCGCAKENTGISENHFDKLKEWAGHAHKINCTAIYIGPLFESVGHGYETTDYKKVDCRLGTNNDFKEFVNYCHNNGMHVIVDGVFNHVGRKFFAFEDLKEKRECSQYKDWFCNVNFGGNNEFNDGFSYDNWGGHNSLAKLNQRNQEVKDYLFNVIKFWVEEFDIDGIRLDAADVLDFGFMGEMRLFTNSLKEDFWLMGEVIHGDYSRWANDDMLYSVTNYELHKGLYSGHNDHNYFEIAHSVKRLLGMCSGRRLYTFIDNHDVERIYTKLKNKEHMYNITMLLYTLYGIPSIYYGSEFGIEGKKERGSDWTLRPCLELEDFKDAYEENVITNLCMQLGQAKKDYGELYKGEYKEMFLTNRQFAYGRLLDGSAVVTGLNNDDKPAVFYVDIPFDVKEAVNIIKAPPADKKAAEASIDITGNRLHFMLPANYGMTVYVK